MSVYDNIRELVRKEQEDRKKYVTGGVSNNHFILRAEERYGVKLTESDIADLIRQINTSTSFYIGPNENSTKLSTLHVVYFRGITMLVAYLKEQNTIATALNFPKDFKKRYGIDRFYSTFEEWQKAKKSVEVKKIYKERQ